MPTQTNIPELTSLDFIPYIDENGNLPEQYKGKIGKLTFSYFNWRLQPYAGNSPGQATINTLISKSNVPLF